MTEDERRFYDECLIRTAAAMADARWKDNGANFDPSFVASRAANIAAELLKQRRAFLAKQVAQS